LVFPDDLKGFGGVRHLIITDSDDLGVVVFPQM
jgi:hypothetical protein